MKIIAIEGIDGSGKTVQYNLLKESLTEMGFTVASMDFPAYDSFFGKILGRLLKGEKHTTAQNTDPMSMALWFAMDRKMQFEKGLPECDILLLNRYVLSNAAYQGARCDDTTDMSMDEMIDWIYELEHRELSLPEADIYFFLNVSKKQADKNVRKKGFRDYVGGESKDVYEDSDDMQTRAKNAYLRCAEKFRNVITIECMRDGELMPIEKIHGIITDKLRENKIIN